MHPFSLERVLNQPQWTSPTESLLDIPVQTPPAASDQSTASNGISLTSLGSTVSNGDSLPSGRYPALVEKHFNNYFFNQTTFPWNTNGI
ncbi:hypothetical protein L596_003388 [Steinernema carpocapsae]|uniref:Uncharacterized protein n=1 Tax=Steinernema carpocapsae TaxID=34508 RepID=A0A4U8UTZ4_STECR|nr:hypothetical protein L596_003388 [Steinernema carpocapsae]